jgi:antitoxin CptB
MPNEALFINDDFLLGLEPESLLGERELSKLRWRCRRGLLENDLKIEAYFKRFTNGLTVKEAKALYDLMDLSDNDLMDLLLQRNDLPASLDSEDRRAVLAQLRMSTLEPSASTPLTC